MVKLCLLAFVAGFVLREEMLVASQSTQRPLGERPDSTWQEKYGGQLDQAFSGPLSFSHIPYALCLQDETATFDVAILGMPFDTSVSYRTGCEFLPCRLSGYLTTVRVTAERVLDLTPSVPEVEGSVQPTVIQCSGG